MLRKLAWRLAPALSLAVLLAACDESQSPPANLATVSGRVLFAESGQPVKGVDVILERCQGMMSSQWHGSMWDSTDSLGCFRFEYTRESMHRYRVGVDMPMRGSGGECYLREAYERDIVLRVPEATP